MDLATFTARKKLRSVIGIVILLSVVIALILTYPSWKPLLPLSKSGDTANQEAPTITSASDAARLGVQAFFTTDFSKGQNTWISSVCAVSNSEGCQITKGVYAKLLWPSIEKKKLRVVSKAISAEKANDFQKDGKPYQIWKVVAETTNLDTNKSAQGPIYAVITSENGRWFFVRVMFEEEMSKYQGEIK